MLDDSKAVPDRKTLRVLLTDALNRADRIDSMVAIHIATAIDALDRAQAEVDQSSAR